jgi:hypothetical protein
VALSRHKERVLLFGSRQELEAPQDLHVQGKPRGDLDWLRRVALQLAEQAQASATSADDRQVLDDLGRAPRRPDPDCGRDGADRSRRGTPRSVARRIAERSRGTRRPPPGRDDRQPAPAEYAEPLQPGGPWGTGRPELPGRSRGYEPPRREKGIER